MEVLASHILADTQKIKKQKPIILNLSNFVAMDFNANALLAVGASPIMAQAPEEIEELVNLSDAVVLNIGTLDQSWMKSIQLAAQYANQYNKPLILDPVGAGASRLRTQFCLKLLEEYQITTLRGNASEILALMDHPVSSHGIDSTHSTHSTHSSRKSLNVGRDLSIKFKCVVTISGSTDYIIDETLVWAVENGHPMMTQVTAMGCTATSLIGAFLAVNSNPIEAARNAMAQMGVCGERAANQSRGPGSLRLKFLDELYQFSTDSMVNLKVSLQ